MAVAHVVGTVHVAVAGGGWWLQPVGGSSRWLKKKGVEGARRGGVCGGIVGRGKGQEVRGLG